MVLSQQNTSSVPIADHDSLETVASPETPAILTPPMDSKLQALSSRPGSVLLVTNLPTVLFSHASDLRPLLCPFGDIVQLKLLNRPGDTDSLSVSVEYKTIIQAQEAKGSLDGQLYADRCLKADFLLPEPPSPVNTEFSGWSTPASDGKPGLNPFAAPFHVQSGASSASSLAFNPFKYNVQGCSGSDEELGYSRYWSSCSTPFLAPSSSHSHLHAGSGLFAPSLATFRPHSAPSQ